MPAWIHGRAEHLLAKNPSMSKSTAFAVATQQAHKLGKTPKGFGTAEGKREAKAKFDKPKKEYVKTDNPGDLETKKLPREKKASALFDLAETCDLAVPAAFIDELTKTAKYLTDQVDKPKTKPLNAAPPNKSFQVKQGTVVNPYSVENTGMDPRQKLLKSQKVGKPADYKQPKLKPLNIKVGFQTSQYSGPMGPVLGPRQHSMIPPFVMPNVKTGGPPSEESVLAYQKYKERKKEAASPAGMLASTQKVGKPKTTAPPGPSIAQISKPVGFGRPLPGAKKGNNII